MFYIHKRLLYIYENWQLKSNNIDEFKKILKELSQTERNIINNIIIFKKIKTMIINNPIDNIKILLPVYSKYKENKINKFFIHTILKLDSKTKNKLNKELFKLKPIEEQNKIRKNINRKMKEKYDKLSSEQKKKFNRNRIIKKIEKIGYTKYKLNCLNMYKKWYHNLSEEKKKNYSEKRKQKYIMLPDEVKEKYKINKQNKLLLIPEAERSLIWKKNLVKRKNKINNLPHDEKKAYFDKLRLRKKIYFDNITIEKRKVINKIRTFKRQLNKNYITLEEFNQKKSEIIEQNIKFI